MTPTLPDSRSVVPGPGSERETPIYLDYNATTPLDPAVAEVMEPFLRSQFGNPSSAHEYGASARVAVEHARAQVARLLGCDPEEIVFTGSGSEATNLALKGLVFAARSSSPFHDLRLITSAVEHPATLETCRFLERLGCRVSILPVDRHGIVDLDALRAALRQSPLAVSIMHANNEVGTLEPIEQIAEIVHEHGALLHVDAAQSIGKIEVDSHALSADLLTLAGHKLYAQRASARSTYEKASTWNHSCTEVVRRDSYGVAPRASRTSLGSAPRPSSPERRYRRRRPGSRPCATGYGSDCTNPSARASRSTGIRSSDSLTR